MKMAVDLTGCVVTTSMIGNLDRVTLHAPGAQSPPIDIVETVDSFSSSHDVRSRSFSWRCEFALSFL
jgi:hypothetical protein